MHMNNIYIYIYVFFCHLWTTASSALHLKCSKASNVNPFKNTFLKYGFLCYQSSFHVVQLLDR